MIRSSFRYARPGTIAEAAALLAEAGPRGRVLGGGSVLVPAMSAGLDNPGLVIDLRRLALRTIRETDGHVVLGASTTYSDLKASPVVRTRLPLLAAMADEVTGGPGLWNLATPAGAACHANPASDTPGCLVALDAGFRLVSVRGERVVPATEFFHGAFETERAADEILTELVIAAPACAGLSAYLKLKGSASSWPIVTASCFLPRPDRIRLAMGAAATVPIVREWSLRDGSPHIGDMAQEVVDGMRVEWADELAGPGYRLAVAGTVVRRALRRVLGASP